MKQPNYLLAIIAIMMLQACTNSTATIPAPLPNAPTTVQKSNKKTAAELRKELASQELSIPAEMLIPRGIIRQNQVLVQRPDLFHHSVYKQDGYIVSGEILSKATIAKFKDARIRLTFYSETHTELGNTEFTLYKYFEPGRITAFETKVYPSSEMKEFSIAIVDAVGAAL